MERKFDLPYGLDFEKVIEVTNEAKNRPGISDTDLAVRIGSTYPRAKSACLEFGLLQLQDGKPTLTVTGREFAWELDAGRRSQLLLTNVLMKYYPYEIALNRMAKESATEVESMFVHQIWAKDMGVDLGIDNLGRATSMLFQLMEAAGLGKYYIGRRGAKTRFVFGPDARKRILAAATPLNSSTVQTILQDDSNTVPGVSIDSKAPETGTERGPVGPKDAALQPLWAPLQTEFFQLKIQKTAEAWDLLENMIPLYRKTLGIDEIQEKHLPPDQKQQSDKSTPVG